MTSNQRRRASCARVGYDAEVSIGGTTLPAPVPGPGTCALMLAGLAGVGLLGRRRRAAA